MIFVFFIVCVLGCVFGSRIRLLLFLYEDDLRVDWSKLSEIFLSLGLGLIIGFDSVGIFYRNLLEKKIRELEEVCLMKCEG